NALKLRGLLSEPEVNSNDASRPPTMKLTLTAEPRWIIAPASTRRKNAQAPLRSSVDLRSGMSGAIVIEAAPAPEPGHCSAPGVALPCWATTLAPLTASVAVCASPLSVSGLTVKLRLGCVPPVGKKVSRISAACWKRRNVVTDSGLVMLEPLRQLQVLEPVLASAARLAEKNLSMTPLGAKMRAKSASGASRSLREKG